MNLTVLMLAMCVFLLALLLVAREFIKQMERYVGIMTGTTTDKAVDEFFRKAVIISNDSFKKDKAVGEELEKKIIERACVIVSDVLLQHKLKPRQFNLEGLCRVAMLKLGIISMRKGVNTNG